MSGRERPDYGDARVALNRSERLYLALEGVAGSVTQVYAIRFGGPVSADAVRRAFRDVIRAHPRLRGVVEKTTFGYALRIRPDDATVSALADVAFQVDAPGDTDEAALGIRMSAVLNDPFAIERDLPIRARFIPHAERPVVILAMHHIAGDGKSVLAWIDSLYRALSGETLPIHPLDPPWHGPAVLPRGLRAFARAASAGLAEMTRSRPYPGDPIEPPGSKLSSFAPMTTIPFRVRTPASALVRAARARGTTLGTLLFSAVATTMRDLVPTSEGGFIRARQSIDLRELFPEASKPGDGNYVSTFVIDVDPRGGLDAMLPEIDAETRRAIDRFGKRETVLGELASEAQTWIGRKLLGRIALASKMSDRLPKQSFHLSNLGRVDGFDQGAVPIEAIYPSLPHTNFFIGAIGFRGSLLVTLNYPRGEISDEFVRAFATKLDDLLAGVADGAPAKVRDRGAAA